VVECITIVFVMYLDSDVLRFAPRRFLVNLGTTHLGLSYNYEG
jgi:hypothetical protein